MKDNIWNNPDDITPVTDDSFIDSILRKKENVMKVYELIQELAKYDADKDVVVELHLNMPYGTRVESVGIKEAFFKNCVVIALNEVDIDG